MSIVITSPAPGSLRITNTASPSLPSMYWCNMQTDNVQGYSNPPGQYVQIVNNRNQTIWQAQVQNISSIGGVPFSGTLQQAVDDIAGLLTTAPTPTGNLLVTTGGDFIVTLSGNFLEVI